MNIERIQFSKANHTMGKFGDVMQESINMYFEDKHECEYGHAFWCPAYFVE